MYVDKKFTFKNYFMSNTHILIPIKDIEENIKVTMIALQHAPENQTLNDGINFWTKLLSDYKQISLDEKVDESSIINAPEIELL